MQQQNLRVDGDRLWASLMRMAEIGATPKGGVNRQALTDEDKAGRDLFVEWVRDAGCTLRVDAVGNIFARRPGKNPDLAPVQTGSHLDSQPTGGKFDGAYGVLAGLEVIRSLNDRGLTRPKRPVEVVVWTNEEGCAICPGDDRLRRASAVRSRWPTMLLDRADPDGQDDRRRADAHRLCRRPTRSERQATVGAFFETHIEQGPILEAEEKTIGDRDRRARASAGTRSP